MGDPTDTQMLDWLETKVVNVRQPLPHGSRSLFWASDDDLEDPKPSDLRAKIRAAMSEGGEQA